MSQKIAFFDFDGTITTKDTLLEFIRFYKGGFSFYTGFLLNSPFIVAFKLGIISNHSAKQKVLRYFFKGESAEDFTRKSDAFSKNEIPKLLRPKALEEIKQLQDAGFNIVVVSASAENWIAGWASSLNLQLMGTRLEVQNNKITGKFAGNNCHGEEKVCRIREQFDLSQYREIYAYGDSSGDKPMLSLANISFYKPFR